AGRMHYLLMVLVAGATVASFEAVGSILVVAMLVCPAATARLLTDRLVTQILSSVAIAFASAVLGYIGASVVPGWFGLDSVNAAGSITVASGVLLVLAIVGSPTHGVLARVLRQRGLVRRVLRDDVLAALYRAGERGSDWESVDSVAKMVGRRGIGEAVIALSGLGLVEQIGDRLRLTPRGADRARDVVRRHRLWERYLVDEAGLSPDHVHDPAELLEHVEVRPEERGGTDPHGRAIP
ncbi:MAG: iron dependent repressor, metal binding and dimerization domain protein, partial [Planctomycetota bacterium]